MRLIDADAADVDKIMCYYSGHCRIEDVQEWLDDQPTIDAEWELFQRITDTYYGKQMFFLQDDGSVYDRYEAVYHASIDAAIDAFILRISEG